MEDTIMKKSIFYVFGLLVLAIGAVFFYQKVGSLDERLSEYELTPQIADAAGITPNTSFVLESSADLSATVVKKYLQFEPSIDYEIKKIGSGSSIFEITPATTLDENSVYSIRIAESPIAARTFSWAYQVKAPFQVVSSLPRDKTSGVPTNSGIEITFNRENLVNPEDSFEISPFVSGKFELHRDTLIFIPSQELNPKTVYTVKIKSGIKTRGSDDTLSNDTEINFETSEKYNREPSPYFKFGKTFWEYKPEAEIAFAVSYSRLPADTIPLAVYKFENMEEFVSAYSGALNEKYEWAHYGAYNPFIPAANKKVFESNVPLEEQTRVKFIRVPQKLNEGFYLADVFVNNEHQQAWFQVTPIAGFSAISGSKTVLWLKDLANGRNVSSAEISFEGRRVGKTGNDGVVMFETPTKLIRSQDESAYYLSSPYFYTVSVGNRQLAVPVESEYGYFSKVSSPDTWWDYFSLDRGIYLPTDQVHFWGIAKQRSGTDIKGEEVLIQLTNPFWAGTPKDEITVYGETKVEISDFYTLTGDISFSDLKPGLYQLSVKRGDEIIVSENVNVETYVKPAYKLTLTADKKAVFAGDTINYKVSANFFDGTPVADLQLNYNGYLFGQISGEIRLNQDGEGLFSVKTDYQEDRYDYWPRYLGINVSPTVSEEGEINSSLSVLVFGPQLDLRSEQTISDKTSKFDLTLKQIILSKIQEGESWWNSDNYLGNPIPGWSVAVKVEEIIHQRTEISRQYDIINKTTYPVYRYSTEYKPLTQDRLVTNGKGQAHYEWTPAEGKSYRLTFRTTDVQGRTIERQHHVYGGSFSYFGFHDSRSVTLKNLDNQSEYKIDEQIRLQMQDSGGNSIVGGVGKFVFVRVNNGIVSYQASDSPDYLDNFKDAYSPNTSIVGVWFSGSRFINSYPVNLSLDSNQRRLNVEVKKDKEHYRPNDLVKLSLRVTDSNGSPKAAEVNVSGIDEAVFSLNPEEKDIANVLYQDIFSPLIIRSSHYSPLFEGGVGAEKGCFVAGTKVLIPGGSRRIEELRIGDEVLTWKEGSTKELVKARIKRISSHVVNGYLVVNGKLQITINHRLLVSGVWKQAGAIEIGDTLLASNGREEKVISLGFVPEWRLVYNIELDKYHTYFADDIYVHNEEKGGGGARSDFRDVAIYKSVRTNSNGYAEVSFEVTDNLTSWRLTTQAVTKDLFAGKSVDFVTVGLPFFVETALNRTYLAGDKLNLRVRVFGTAEVEGKVSYMVESETLPFKKIERTGGKVIEIPLGDLTPGQHKIKILARVGGYDDAISRDLNVLTSYFSENDSEFYEVSSTLSDVQGSAKGYTDLLFTSYERGRFYNVLRWLDCACGARVDQKFGQWLSRIYLNRFFGEQLEVNGLDPRSYQTHDGGITLLPYSDKDLELSAKFANLMAGEQATVNQESLRRYFAESLTDRKADSGRVAVALYGLSAFKAPVLVSVRNLQADRNLTLLGKIYVALALDNLGAKEEARNYYRVEIKPSLISQRPFVYINELEGQDDNLLATALLAGLTASLSEAESDGLGQFTIENYPKETLKNFETLLYLKAILPKLGGDKASFSWKTSSKTGSETLEKNEVFHLRLTQAELATLQFGNLAGGRIGLVSKFEKESLPAEVKRDATIGLRRNYSVNGRLTTEFKDGDLVRIDLIPTFAPGALEGSYQVVDYLPSGLRAVTNLQRTPIYRGLRYHLYPAEVEDQRVTFVIEKNFSSPLFYYARVVSKGDYKAEPALIQSLKSFDSKNISDEARVSIR